MGRKQLEYALYKGDELLAAGTLKEIGEKLNIKSESVRLYGNPSYWARCPKGEGRVLVNLEDDDE
jgi:hypothetical protein